MNLDLLPLLRCPASGLGLTVETGTAIIAECGDVEEGWLISENGEHRYLIRGGIPRFVPDSNYANNFGLQWNRFARTQLDSHSGHPISAERFWKATGWDRADLNGQWVLDAGCGSGRFAEIALNAGAKVMAIDYSSAVDACYANLKHFHNLHVVQADICRLPFAPGCFPYVYSLGVLQHTPDVAAAFAALPPLLRPGGQLCTDFYWRRFRSLMHPRYILRPFTKRIDPERLFEWLEVSVPALLRASQAVGRIPFVGRAMQRLLVVADYTGVYPLSQRQLEEWALLDTFDMLAPAYDKPQSAATVSTWFRMAGFSDIEVFQGGHLVARGRKGTVRP